MGAFYYHVETKRGMQVHVFDSPLNAPIAVVAEVDQWCDETIGVNQYEATSGADARGEFVFQWKVISIEDAALFKLRWA